MIRFLLISTFFIITSCSLSTTKDLIEKEITKNEIGNTYFSNIDFDYVYKAKIDIYGNKLGGILVVKKINNQSHRVVFTTEFGNKLFDFSFENGLAIKNFVIKELNKKVIVKMLQEDFKLLISEKLSVVNQFETNTEEVFKTIQDNQFSFYFYNKNSYTLDKIVSTSKSKEKVEVLFSNTEPQIANSILINHKNIKLTIALEKFKKD